MIVLKIKLNTSSRLLYTTPLCGMKHFLLAANILTHQKLTTLIILMLMVYSWSHPDGSLCPINVQSNYQYTECNCLQSQFQYHQWLWHNSSSITVPMYVNMWNCQYHWILFFLEATYICAQTSLLQNELLTWYSRQSWQYLMQLYSKAPISWGSMRSRKKVEFANAHHHVFNIVFSSLGIDELVVSLQSVLYCLPTLLFVLLHCWMRNSIASVSECMIQLASPSIIPPALQSLPMVILALLPR